MPWLIRLWAYSWRLIADSMSGSISIGFVMNPMLMGLPIIMPVGS
jgi:hypothetical protein